MSNNRNRMIGSFEDAIERGQTSIKKSAVNTASDFGKSTKQQITGSSSQQPAGDQGTNEAGTSPQASDQPQMTDEERVEFLSDLYGKNNSNNKANSSGATDPGKSQKGAGDVSQALGVPQKDQYEGKTPEEIAQIKALENRLHSEYYQNLVNRPKEEPVAEKLEREEEEQKMADLNEENKKPKGSINPQMVKQGTGERVLSTVG
jgi:hypothetical protein